ncbi:hypothetical protein F7725_012065 [Dissostichus mawsoni]|uniref:Uncharacterized protein n=1 Tax=Dissostichus mawsoni TaxID=36200 RepID=A0A7J5ZAN9_DISMA|nr:hypothetical protein F7725_012065 [Dissostichus mawsoni]
MGGEEEEEEEEAEEAAGASPLKDNSSSWRLELQSGKMSTWKLNGCFSTLYCGDLLSEIFGFLETQLDHEN